MLKKKLFTDKEEKPKFDHRLFDKAKRPKRTKSLFKQKMHDFEYFRKYMEEYGKNDV